MKCDVKDCLEEGSHKLQVSVKITETQKQTKWVCLCNTHFALLRKGTNSGFSMGCTLNKGKVQLWKKKII